MRKKVVGTIVRVAAFTVLAFGLNAVSGSSQANAENLGYFNVTGGTKGTDYSYESNSRVLTINSGKAITVKGTNISNNDGLDGHIFITGSANVNLTISDLDIRHMEFSKAEAPIQIDDNYTGTATITIAGDKNKLSSAGTPAIMKNGDKSKLVINGNGTLNASVSGAAITDKAWPAVIGGNAGMSSGNIQIDNGKLILKSYSGGACIGGGSSDAGGKGGNANNIVINGGNITASIEPYKTTSGKTNDRTNMFASCIGAAIGAGGNGNADGIYIHGGTINASVVTRLSTDAAGAAIGGGCNGAGKNIVIDGGDKIAATVNSNVCGCAIGSGYKEIAANGFNTETSITISGGFVVAKGFERSAGIGGYGSADLADNAKIVITGGRVEATGGTYAPGIGGGRCSNAKVYISGGNVKAVKGSSAKNAIGLENDSIDRNNAGTGNFTATLQRSETDTAEVSVQTKTDSSLANLPVEVSITDPSGKAVATDYYGMTGMSADSTGAVYVYLPAGYTLTGMKKGADPEKPVIDPSKITPDMSGVKWVYVQNGKATDYVSGTTKLSTNGSTYELNVTGLPEGVSVLKYETVNNKEGLENTVIDNAQKDAATYKTTAYFKVVDAALYNVPEKMEVVWTLDASTTVQTDDGSEYEIKKPAGDTSGGNTDTGVIYKGNNDPTATEVKVPDTVVIDGQEYVVTEVEAGAFSNNKKIKKITIGKNVKVIGDKAFYKCTKLTSVVIPAKVTKIGKNAFYGCKKLKKITIKSKKLKTVGKNAIKGIHKKAVIKCPSKKFVKKYKKLFSSKTGLKKSMKIK